MLRVTVELWPGGDSSRRREIAVCDIANVTSLASVSTYDVRWRPIASEDIRVKVRHRRLDLALVLLAKAFARLVGELPVPGTEGK